MVASQISRLTCLRCMLPNQCSKLAKHPVFSNNFTTYSKVFPSKSKSSVLIGIIAGVGLGAGYSFYKMNDIRRHKQVILNPGMGTGCRTLSSFPAVRISREVLNATDTSGLKITVFQYPTCPFCCKVRAFLDFYGFSYNVVEVNPVLRQQLRWSDYKKVPILLVETEEGYLQLNDSSMIISALTSYLHDKDLNVKQVANYYPSIKYADSDGSTKTEILNKYFLMYQGIIPEGTSKEDIANERKWRKWADEVLVHVLSPNVYRTMSEALESFHWFSEIGEWEKEFSFLERYLVIYVGAVAMWIIGKRLKHKYNLKDDVRQSLYDESNNWLKHLKQKGTFFHGGTKPDLADLAVYGVLSSIEGCAAFRDLTERTRITTWYNAVKQHTAAHAGKFIEGSLTSSAVI